MANVKTLIKKLVNNGYSEDKLSMMTEKEIRDTYKIAKEEIAMKKNTNTPETINNATTVEVEKEESTMRTFTLKELVQVLKDNQKVQDAEYIKKDDLKVILNEQFGFSFNNKATRTEMADTVMAMYKDSLRVADEIAYGNEDNNTEEETTMTPVAEVVSVGDLSITSDRIYHDDTIIEKAVPVAKVNNPTPDDTKALTYRLMHKIGDHAINNRKKGFGTTVSAWMLCAYILEVKYGMTHLKGHEHEVTDEMKETVKNVRKWLIDNGYIKTVTFKDEKGFVFYTPEYDGNRKDKMYDCTKFQATGKVETTTYRVTKEMNKWYK